MTQHSVMSLAPATARQCTTISTARERHLEHVQRCVCDRDDYIFRIARRTTGTDGATAQIGINRYLAQASRSSPSIRSMLTASTSQRSTCSRLLHVRSTWLMKGDRVRLWL